MTSPPAEHAVVVPLRTQGRGDLREETRAPGSGRVSEAWTQVTADRWTSVELDPALTIVREWPRRIGLVVGAGPDQRVLAALDRFGFAPVIVPVADATDTVASMAPFTFLILGADVFGDDGSVELVRSWHRASPAARLKLACHPEHADPAVLVRAMRAGVTDVVDPSDEIAVDAAIRSGMRHAGANRERVLAIGAHPDDVEIGCGGTLLDHRTRGDRITILTLSRGAVGGDERLRLHEAGRTAEAIGAQLIVGDLPDTAIDEGATTIRLIESVVRAIDPTVVYVHSNHDNHQDHRAVNTATRSATRGVRRVFAYQSPSATDAFLPSQFVPIDRVLARKIKVLQMFDTQSDRSYLEPELVSGGARYWARHLSANARYAEPFEVIRSVGDVRHSASAPLAADDRAPLAVPRTFVPPADVLRPAISLGKSAAR